MLVIPLERFTATRVGGSLPEHENAHDHEHRDDRGGERATQCEPAFGERLVEKSPTVAPSGRVRMNAAQKSQTRDRLVQK